MALFCSSVKREVPLLPAGFVTRLSYQTLSVLLVNVDITVIRNVLSIRQNIKVYLFIYFFQDSVCNSCVLHLSLKTIRVPQINKKSVNFIDIL